MLIIEITDNDTIDKALRRYKKKFEKTGTLKQLRARKHFVKPSITRRAEIKKATYRVNVLVAQES